MGIASRSDRGERVGDLRRRWGAYGAKPPNPQIFELLRCAGRNASASAERLEPLLRDWPDDNGLREEITRLEHEGDRLTHKVVNALRISKLSPFDREDVFALVGAIDDVVDDIEEVSEQMATKRIEAPMEQAQALAGVLRDCCRELSAALEDLETLEGIEEHLKAIRRLEGEGDQIFRSALAALFRDAIDPMFVLRWKDIYEALEEGIDRSKAAANYIESIIVKHA